MQAIWDRLDQSDDVYIQTEHEPGNAANGAAEVNTEQDVPLANHLSASAHKRVYATEDRIWEVVAGHEKDFTRVPKSQFQILCLIAANGSVGILQPDVVRLTKQDKRSVPNRTDQLAAHGYITKETVLAKGSKTSLLKLRGHNVAFSNTTAAGEAVVRYDIWFDMTMRILKENGGVVVFEDLLLGLDIFQDRWKTVAYRRCIRRLSKSGCVRRVNARVEGDPNDASTDKYLRSLQLVREPTKRDLVLFSGTSGASAPKKPRPDSDDDAEQSNEDTDEAENTEAEIENNSSILHELSKTSRKHIGLEDEQGRVTSDRLERASLGSEFEDEQQRITATTKSPTPNMRTRKSTRKSRKVIENETTVNEVDFAQDAGIPTLDVAGRRGKRKASQADLQEYERVDKVPRAGTSDTSPSPRSSASPPFVTRAQNEMTASARPGVYINPPGSHPAEANEIKRPGRRKKVLIAVFKSDRLTELECFRSVDANMRTSGLRQSSFAGNIKNYEEPNANPPQERRNSGSGTNVDAAAFNSVVHRDTNSRTESPPVNVQVTPLSSKPRRKYQRRARKASPGRELSVGTPLVPSIVASRHSLQSDDDPNSPTTGHTAEQIAPSSQHQNDRTGLPFASDQVDRQAEAVPSTSSKSGQLQVPDPKTTGEIGLTPSAATSATLPKKRGRPSKAMLAERARLKQVQEAADTPENALPDSRDSPAVTVEMPLPQDMELDQRARVAASVEDKVASPLPLHSPIPSPTTNLANQADHTKRDVTVSSPRLDDNLSRGDTAASDRMTEAADAVPQAAVTSIVASSTSVLESDGKTVQLNGDELGARTSNQRPNIENLSQVAADRALEQSRTNELDSVQACSVRSRLDVACQSSPILASAKEGNLADTVERTHVQIGSTSSGHKDSSRELSNIEQILRNPDEVPALEPITVRRTTAGLAHAAENSQHFAHSTAGKQRSVNAEGAIPAKKTFVPKTLGRLGSLRSPRGPFAGRRGRIPESEPRLLDAIRGIAKEYSGINTGNLTLAWDEYQSQPADLDDILQRVENLGTAYERSPPSPLANSSEIAVYQFSCEVDKVCDWECTLVENKGNQEKGDELVFVNHGIDETYSLPYISTVNMAFEFVRDDFNLAYDLEQDVPNIVSSKAHGKTGTQAHFAGTRQPRLVDQNNSVPATVPHRVLTTSRPMRTTSTETGLASQDSKQTYSSVSEYRQASKTPSPPFVESERLCVAVALVRMLCTGVTETQTLNWSIVRHAMGFKYDVSILQQRWKYQVANTASQQRSKQIEQDLYTPLLTAYETGELPNIDFDGLQYTDWPALVRWAETYISEQEVGAALDHFETSHEALLDEFEVRPVALPQKTEATASVDDSARCQPTPKTARGTLITPLSSTMQLDQASGLDTTLAKSWIRANAMTKKADYNPAEATRRLTSLGESTLKRASDELITNGTVVRTNQGRRLPGRNMVLSRQAHVQLERWLRGAANTDHILLTSTITAWEKLVSHFSDHDSLTFDPNTTEAEMLILTNMLANHRLEISLALPARNDAFDAPPPKLSKWPHSGPMYSWGATDTSSSIFPVTFTKTSTFTTSHNLDLSLPKPFRPQPLVVPGELGARIPFWIDFHGNFLEEMWRLVVRSLLFLVVFRPGITVAGMEGACERVLGGWEIALCVGWLERVGIVKRCDESRFEEGGESDGVDGWKRGWRAGEWWYLVFAEDEG